MSGTRHRRAFMGGRMTAEQAHAQYAFPPAARCMGCGSNRPYTRAIVMLEMKEALKNPSVSLLAQLAPEDILKQTVQIKGSDGKPRPYFRVSVVYACKTCTPAMEKQLAKAPSHAIVEINRGPSPDRIIST